MRLTRRQITRAYLANRDAIIEAARRWTFSEGLKIIQK